MDIVVQAMKAGDPLRLVCPRGQLKDATAATFWTNASSALVETLSSLPAGGRVLEVGSGLGAAGISAAKMGFDVTLSDFDDSVVRALGESAELNKVACKAIKVDFMEGPVGLWDMVMASDVSASVKAAKALAEFCTASSSLAVVAHEERRAVYRDDHGEIKVECHDDALMALRDVFRSKGWSVVAERRQKPAIVLVFKNKDQC